MARESIFSVDVEDWFHILALPDAPDVEAWGKLPSHVEKNFRRMLDLFDERGAKVTCFVLGWVAERYPEVVREAHRRGHEIASHGYAHQLTYELGAERFHEDVKKARGILEGIIGSAVIGYRTPGFSVTKDTPWFHDELARAGYRYSSSVFPAPRAHGGLETKAFAPHRVETAHGPMVEYPITVREVLGRPMCFFGGGYLRLFPYPLIKKTGKEVLDSGRPLIFYVHPREIDPGHPRLPMNAVRTFKSYVGLGTTEPKIRSILRDFPVTTFAEHLARHSELSLGASSVPTASTHAAA